MGHGLPRTVAAGRSSCLKWVPSHQAGHFSRDGVVRGGESMQRDQFCVQGTLPHRVTPEGFWEYQEGLSPQWLGLLRGDASLSGPSPPPSSSPKTSAKGPAWEDGSVGEVPAAQV